MDFFDLILLNNKLYKKQITVLENNFHYNTFQIVIVLGEIETAFEISIEITFAIKILIISQVPFDKPCFDQTIAYIFITF